ncbi:hypothetical protein HYV49_00160 [Candidatus Pacearchaeota archaeon]|nr:hypothetical protein [Candidatus Pacearchaeota archaeon]
MKRKIIFFVSIGLIIITLFSIALSIFASKSVLERRAYYTSIIVADYGGLAANGSAFIFGAVPPGSSAEKELNVKNGYEFPIVVYIIPNNGMEQFVQAKQEIIFMGEDRNISIVASVPVGMEKKKYEGEIAVEIRAA